MNADSKPGAPPAAPPGPAFGFWRVFGRHWQSSVRYYGLRHTVAQLGEAAYRFFRELLPGRRKARYGDLDYDFEHRVDTTRANVGFRPQLIAALSGHQYFPTEPWLFEQIMRALPTGAASNRPSAVSQTALKIPLKERPKRSPLAKGELGELAKGELAKGERDEWDALRDNTAGFSPGLRNFTFVDLGSGKGRVLLMAAPYGFKKIIGVEFIPEWHRVAQENIRKYAEISAQENQPATAIEIESFCMDALDFHFPDGPLVVYLFNPFPEPVLAAVLDRLRQSLLQNPRPAFLAYRYPEFDSLLQKCGWLRKIAGTEQWAVYGGIGKSDHRTI